MYIYEGHLGGLYTSDYVLDYEDLYCETCGDSDTYIGYADTREEAWALLKWQTDTFDNSTCENCPHGYDYVYCDTKCKNASHSDGWDYGYIMQFLYANFESDNQDIYLILAAKHSGCNNMLFVKCEKGYYVPEVPAIDERFTQHIRNLTALLNDYKDDSLCMVAEKHICGKKYILFTCESEEPDGGWEDVQHCGSDGCWYGYKNFEDIKYNFLNPDVYDFIKENLF